MRIWPRSPRAIIARACSISWWPEQPEVTPTILFFAPDSASSSRACALVKHSGFSQTTCSPACSAAWQISKWVSLGVATDTARMPSGRRASASNSARESAWQRPPPARGAGPERLAELAAALGVDVKGAGDERKAAVAQRGRAVDIADLAALSAPDQAPGDGLAERNFSVDHGACSP